MKTIRIAIISIVGFGLLAGVAAVADGQMSPTVLILGASVLLIGFGFFAVRVLLSMIPPRKVELPEWEEVEKAAAVPGNNYNLQPYKVTNEKVQEFYLSALRSRTVGYVELIADFVEKHWGDGAEYHNLMVHLRDIKK